MSAISAQINLIDRLTGPMQRMIQSAEDLANHINSVESAMNEGFDPVVIEEARHQAEVFQSQINSVKSSIDNAEAEQQNFNSTVNQGQTAMGGLVGKAIALTSAYMGVGKLMNMSDEITQTTARLNMMNDGAQATSELFDMVYRSAQNARAPIDKMADVVARFGNNAKDAFGSSKEVVDFANLVQKQMTIAGAGTAESANAMLQLSQALGSGALRGDEFNSIFEQAPNLIQNIADYMNVPVGSIKQLAEEGQLTADIVKNAVFASADEINKKFDSMPFTWAQVWSVMSNGAIIKLQPLLYKINSIANSEQFQTFAANAVNALGAVTNVLIGIIDIAGSVASFIIDNWSLIEPVVMGVVSAFGLYNGILLIHKGILLATAVVHGIAATATAIHTAFTSGWSIATFTATAAQSGLNAALLACPLTWIVLAIVAVITVIYLAIAAINKAQGTTVSATGVIMGVFATVAAFIGNIFLADVNFIIGLFLELVNVMISFANFFRNVLVNPVRAIAHLFQGLFDFIVGIVQSAAGMIDTLLGTDLSGAVQGFRNNVAAFVDEKVGKQKYEVEKINPNDYMLKRFEYSKAWDKGYTFGEGIENKVKGMFGGGDDKGGVDTSNVFGGGGYTPGSYDTQVPANIADTAKNTGAAANSLEITSEDLKYMRDIAERDVINRFTTAEIKIDMTNHNNVAANTDLDGLVSDLAEKAGEALNKVAEGVHK